MTLSDAFMPLNVSAAWLGMITPIGGLAFILGWGCLVIAVLKNNF